MRASVSTGVLWELEPEDAVRLLAEMGWEGLELYSEHLKRLSRREEAARRLRQLCEELGAPICAVHDNTQGLEPSCVVRLASELGARWVVVHPDSSKGAAENLEGVRAWAALAREAGVGIAVENMHSRVPGGRGGRVFGSEPGELIWLAERSDPEVVGVCWDTCHAYVQGLDQRSSIVELGRYLAHVHLNDNISRAEEQHLAPFEGLVDWEGVFRGLRDIGYRGAAVLEGGFTVTRLPLSLRLLKLRYLLELVRAMIAEL